VAWVCCQPDPAGNVREIEDILGSRKFSHAVARFRLPIVVGRLKCETTSGHLAKDPDSPTGDIPSQSGESCSMCPPWPPEVPSVFRPFGVEFQKVNGFSDEKAVEGHVWNLNPLARSARFAPPTQRNSRCA